MTPDSSPRVYTWGEVSDTGPSRWHVSPGHRTSGPPSPSESPSHVYTPSEISGRGPCGSGTRDSGARVIVSHPLWEPKDRHPDQAVCLHAAPLVPRAPIPISRALRQTPPIGQANCRPQRQRREEGPQCQRRGGRSHGQAPCGSWPLPFFEFFGIAWNWYQESNHGNE